MYQISTGFGQPRLGGGYGPRWGRMMGGGLGPRAAEGTCPQLGALPPCNAPDYANVCAYDGLGILGARGPLPARIRPWVIGTPRRLRKFRRVYGPGSFLGWR